MTLQIADLQKALDVLRKVEQYKPETAAPGQLGLLRAEAFCARSRIEAVLGIQEVEVQS